MKKYLTQKRHWPEPRDIVAETISDHTDVRRITREKALKFGSLLSEKKSDAEDARGVYRIYYEFQQRIDRDCSRIRCWRSIAVKKKRF